MMEFIQSWILPPIFGLALLGLVFVIPYLAIRDLLDRHSDRNS